MNKFIGARKRRLLAGAVFALTAGLAQAQYVWVDHKGIRQFSDRAPPPSIPLKNILKAPGHQLPAVDVAASAEAGAGTGTADTIDANAKQAKAPPTLAERNADFRKRAKEQAENEQKAADETRHKAAQAENCNTAREYRQQLDSGVRIGATDKNGTRTIIDDFERARRGAKVDKVLEGCR